MINIAIYCLKYNETWNSGMEKKLELYTWTNILKKLYEWNHLCQVNNSIQSEWKEENLVVIHCYVK